MSLPILSVIIPTRGRSHTLSRAVSSALASAPDGDVEVIVVPNGPESNEWGEWTGPLSDPRVRLQPLELGHACAARNHGFNFATGKYTRFLDDDDVLFPESACAQLSYIDDVGADLCSGRLQHMNSKLQYLSPVGFTDKSDFVCAACDVSGFTLPTGNVFLTSALKGARWNESVPRFQDNVWMLELAYLREWNWSHFNQDVGGWVHHDGERVSSTTVNQPLPYWVIESLLTLYEKLTADGRNNEARSSAILEALWRVVHIYFPRFPFQCHRYAQQVLRVDPASRPPDFERVASWGLSPLVVEWLMVPKRYLHHIAHSARQLVHGEEIVRRL